MVNVILLAILIVGGYFINNMYAIFSLVIFSKRVNSRSIVFNLQTTEMNIHHNIGMSVFNL